VPQTAYNNATRDLALARILHDRAIASGRSGLAELAQVVRCTQVLAGLMEGKVVPGSRYRVMRA
jgi:hypothetical protein